MPPTPFSDVGEGATSLSELTDVQIDASTLANSQELLYDSTAQRWRNVSFPIQGVAGDALFKQTTGATTTVNSNTPISTDQSGSTGIVRIDTTNDRVGIGKAPSHPLDVSGITRSLHYTGSGDFVTSGDTSTFGQSFANGVISTDNTTVNVNLNGAGGNQAVGFVAVSMVPNSATAQGSIALYSHGHTQGSNQYTTLFEQNDNPTNVGSVTHTGGGTLTITSGSNMVASHSQVYYQVRVVNFIEFHTTVNGT